MNEQEISGRVVKVVATVLGLGDAEANGGVNIAEWDSVKHMNVILAVENEFDIEFDEAELANTHSIPLLVAAVMKHLSA